MMTRMTEDDSGHQEWKDDSKSTDTHNKARKMLRPKKMKPEVLRAYRAELQTVPMAYASVLQLTQDYFDELRSRDHHDEALALLTAPHRTVKEQPNVLEVEGRQFIMYKDNEKRQEKVSGSRLRLIPVILKVTSDDLDMICAKGNASNGLQSVASFAAKLKFFKKVGDSQPAEGITAVRYLYATLLHYYLTDTARGRSLAELAPRGWPGWINVALGHSIKSNQGVAPYVWRLQAP
jgi:hypothetical protein